MKKTVTFHVGGGQAHRTHNARRYKRGQTPDHIDTRRSCRNETLVDLDLRQAYRELFGAALDAYNAKQTRPERQIADYYDKIRADKAKHPVYEVLIQVGDRDTTGTTDCETEIAILREYIETFPYYNPQMMVVGAYIHADEPNGTVHAHLDFIPWADGYKRGLERQCSMSNCCYQQGFDKGEHINQTTEAAWTVSERERLEQIAEAHGIEVDRPREVRPHLDKDDYIAQQKDKELTNSILDIYNALEQDESPENEPEIDLFV